MKLVEFTPKLLNFTKLSPLALVANLHFLKICKITKLQVAPFALFTNSTNMWHFLQWSQILPPGGVTCIATLTWIAILDLSVDIEFVASSARVTSVYPAKGLEVSQFETETVSFRQPEP